MTTDDGGTTPRLLPEYVFTQTEANLSWAHEQASIAFAATDSGADVRLDVRVCNSTDPFGGQKDQEWSESIQIHGTLVGTPGTTIVQVRATQPAPVDVLTFDAAKGEQDTMWISGSGEIVPSHDFWRPLFDWAWRTQASRWHLPLSQDEVEAAVSQRRPLCDRPADGWPMLRIDDHVRFYSDKRFSMPDCNAHPLTQSARFVLDTHKRPTGESVWVVLLVAFESSEIARLVSAGPPTSQDAVAWHASHAGLRPSYPVGWLPGDLVDEATKCLTMFKQALANAQR